jgi:DNA-binding CsgD family transcriptional regulator
MVTTEIRLDIDAVRDEIVVSWQASIASGLRPDAFAPPLDRRYRTPVGLVRAARPVIGRLNADLRGTDVSIVVSDAGSRVICSNPSSATGEQLLNQFYLLPGYCWDVAIVGTNALGLAASLDAPAVVVGDEHFMDALVVVGAAAVPIHDPRTEHMVGVVALICPAESANALLVPVAKQAAAEIEQRLARRRSALGWSSLTDAEGALAELVGLGLTNREAAARLLVSRHTVDAHLRNIFRKLDITSRVQLAHVVATHTAQPAVSN